MDFFEDKQRGILLYPTQAPFLLQALPDARTIDGKYLAVPKNLRNLQILRHYNHPVPPVITDENYDWPHRPGRAPLPHQKIMANFEVLHRRAFNLSDMGCVGGETLIDTASGPQRIAALTVAAKPFLVRTLMSDGPRFVEAPAPFIKGRDDLYRVTFQSGRSIVVTKRHVFLTLRGWTSCEQLEIGEFLPVFDVYPQQSIWEPCHIKLPPGGPRLTQILSDCWGYYETLFYDAPPLSLKDIFQVSIPSRAGVLRRIQSEWRTDARGNKHIRTVQLDDDPQSKRRYAAHFDLGETGSFLSECATKLLGNQFHIYAQYHLSPSRIREDCEGPALQLCIPISSATAPPFDYVTHIAYERHDVYYDMHVPEHENYIAHGLCNHNTMKTLATLWAADYLMKQSKEPFRALIVAPLSTLQRVWADTIFSNFLGKRTFEILHGDAARRCNALTNPADFYLINFDGVGVGAHTRKRLELDGFSQMLAGREDIKLVIVDEASAYKDSQTKRHRLARLIFGKRDYIWALTGTPTPNAPTDAYGISKLLNNAFGKSFTTFQSETMLKVSNFKWVPQRDGYEKAKQLLSPSIRFGIQDVWNGPEMTTQQREVPLTDQQKKLMAELKRDLQLVVKSGQPITAANEAAARLKFMQISLGAVYDANHKAHLVDAKPRMEELKNLIEQAPGKILVFGSLTSIVHILYKELNAWTREVVNGDVSQKERSRIFEAFQKAPDSAPRILIADPGTMAHGLDLWQAQTVIWYGPTDKTELYLQANKRAHRPGQKWPVTVVQIVSNKLEIEIYRRLETNTSLQGALLEMVRKGEL